jgi:hypothetical protein
MCSTFKNGKLLDSAGAWVAVKPFVAGGAAAVNTGAAPILLKAAVASKRHWITKVLLANKTAGEYPVAEIVEDPAGTPAVVLTLVPQCVSAASMGEKVVDFDPPVECTVAKALGYQLQSATGDCYCQLCGFVEA